MVSTFSGNDHLRKEVSFATKPEPARKMSRPEGESEKPAQWVCADEVYGSNDAFRSWCEELRLGCVVATKTVRGLAGIDTSLS